MPLPDFQPSDPTPDEEERRGRRSTPIVGGFAMPAVYPSTTHGSLGSYGPGTAPSGPVWRPYTEKDQMGILNSIVQQQSIFDLQLALVQAGFLDDDDVGFGIVDDATDDAFGTVLSIANQHGIPWQDVLSQAQAAGGTYGGGFGGSGGRDDLAPVVIQLPNRDDVIAAQSDVGYEKTGVRLDDDLVESMAESVLDHYRTQQERQVQREMGAEGGSVMTTEGAPDVARLLEEQVEERAPGLVMSKGVREAMDGWFEAIRGPV